MKNITDILTGFGIQIPEDKQADFEKEFADNYKTIADYQKQHDKLVQAQESLQTAQSGLKAFEGVDVADLKGQITTLQTKLAEQADGFAFDSALDDAIRTAKGRDVKAIRGMLDVEALRRSKDRTSDIQAAVAALVKEKEWAFDTPDGSYPELSDGGDPQNKPSGSTRDQFTAWFEQAMN